MTYVVGGREARSVIAGVIEVDFDTCNAARLMADAASTVATVPQGYRGQGDLCWDPKVYMNPGPATWSYPEMLWGRPYGRLQHAAGRGSPWGPVLDVLESKKRPLVPKAMKPRPGMLHAEVRLLYNALSFKTWQNGRGFDTMITVSASYLGITDHAEFGALLPKMNKAIQEWLANGSDKRRYRRGRSYRPVESTLHQYIYVLERGWKHGLHVHELCVVPPELQADFRLFLTNWWETKACMAIPQNAVNVKFAHSTNARRQYEKQEFWFRYLIKTMNPDLGVRDKCGIYRPMVAVMKPLWRRGMKPEILPIGCPQLYGIAMSLNKAEQQKVGFRSKFDAGRLDELYDGSEVRPGLIRAIGIPGVDF